MHGSSPSFTRSLHSTHFRTANYLVFCVLLDAYIRLCKELMIEQNVLDFDATIALHKYISSPLGQQANLLPRGATFDTLVRQRLGRHHAIKLNIHIFQDINTK